LELSPNNNRVKREIVGELIAGGRHLDQAGQKFERGGIRTYRRGPGVESKTMKNPARTLRVALSEVDRPIELRIKLEPGRQRGWKARGEFFKECPTTRFRRGKGREGRPLGSGTGQGKVFLHERTVAGQEGTQQERRTKLE